MSDFYAQKCSCGAITVSNKEGQPRFDNSMRPVTFKKLFRGKGYRFEWLNETYGCNHCVNHWGLDLCKCGSGDKVGKCTWEGCKHNGQAYQTFQNPNPSIMECIAERGHF